MVFLWGNIVMTVETGQLFPEKFGFNPQQVGLQNISLIVGSVIGEQMGGFLSDWWMWRRHNNKLNFNNTTKEAARTGSDSEASAGAGAGASDREDAAAAPQPEFRLWLGYPGFLLTVCGVVVYLVQVARAAGDGAWDVTPVVGSGIAAAGNQIVTTVMTTYAVDCYRDEAAAVGVFVNLVRQTWGFIGPFWFPQMIADAGFGESAAIAAAMLAGVSIVPTAVVQWKGRSWR